MPQTPQEKLESCNEEVQACPDLPAWAKEYFANVTTFVGGTNPVKPHPIKP